MRRMTDMLIAKNGQTVRRRVAQVALVGAALVCLLAVGLAGDTAASVSAQISPLSPMYVLGSDTPALSLIGLHKVNVMASGQNALTRLSFVLTGIIIGAGVFVWRKS